MKKKSELRVDINKAVTILQQGGLVAFPTETVYGLGADASNPEAVGRIFRVKGRPADHPLIVHISDTKQLSKWAQNIPQSAWTLAKAFWPGPLTMILPRLTTVPYAVTGGLDTIALRVPDHPLALELLHAFKGGLAAPSANSYGRVSPTSAEDVQDELKDGVDLVLDGGRCSIGIESTIVDLSTDIPRVLRPGKITQQDIYAVLGHSFSMPSDVPVNHPGNKPSHYAPKARVILTSLDNVQQHIQKWQQQEVKLGLLSSHLPDTLPGNFTWIQFMEDIDEQAHDLYHNLRQADNLGIEILIAVMPEDQGMGHAVRDRLFRAAGLGNGSDVTVS